MKSILSIMSRHKIAASLLCGACAALSLAAVEVKELDLIRDNTFKPVMMHGRVTAAYGWGMRDLPRMRAGNWYDGKYLSGEGLFDLKVENGTMTVSYPENLYPGYKKYDVEINNIIPWTMLLKGKFRVRARVKVERGKFSIGNVEVKNSPEWQDLDFVTDRFESGFKYRPVANGGFSVSHFSVYPEYEKLGGEIKLPDGGKLTKLLLPKNADHATRWGVALWQNRLWRFTGVALPIEVVDEVKPTPGAFAAVKGKTAPGGWKLKVDKNGIVFTYDDDFTFWPALADYQRDLGYTIYAFRMQPTINPDPNFTLKAVDKEIKPHYSYFTAAFYPVGMVDPIALRSRNLADYYHMPKPFDSHNVNIFMPTEIYHKDHPEYYALDKKGNRPVPNYITQLSSCLSNKDAFEISAKNAVQYLCSMPEFRYATLGLGDAQNSCLCKECVRINGGEHNYTRLWTMFINRVARDIRPKLKNTKVILGVYADVLEPALDIKPEPNVCVYYCVTYKRTPCTLHQDCELNKVGVEDVKTWSKYVGRENMTLMTYRDMRPYHATEQMKRHNKYASDGIFSWIWHGFSPALLFVLNRWNLGDDDVDALMNEFCDHYYGKAGKYVLEANRFIEEYAKNYKHTPDELERYRKGVLLHVGIRCAAPSHKTALDREALDKLYALFDKGLAAIGDSDQEARNNTLQEKSFYILEDLLRYRLSSCKTDEDLAKYAARVVELVKIAREVPRARKKMLKLVKDEDAFTLFTGITIKPSKKEWCFSPEVEEFLKDPVKAISGTPKRIPGGLSFSPQVMRGGSGAHKYNWQCPARVMNSIGRASSGRGVITINFKLDHDVPESSVLVLTGLDDDKPGAARFAVEVNGKRIFEGPNTFPEHDWGSMSIPIPGGLLKDDVNTIKLINTVPESKEYEFAADYRWGWMGFSEAAWFDPNGGFKTFLKGRKARGGWYQAKAKCQQPLGKVEAKDGKLHIEGGDAELTGVAFFRRHVFPKIAASALGKVRMRATASGEGELVLDCTVYGAKKPLGRKLMTKSFKLEAQPKTFECTFDVPPKAISFIPEVLVKGKSKAVVSAFDIDFEPKATEKAKK